MGGEALALRVGAVAVTALVVVKWSSLRAGSHVSTAQPCPGRSPSDRARTCGGPVLTPRPTRFAAGVEWWLEGINCDVGPGGRAARP
jgi:hypothetical protein